MKHFKKIVYVVSVCLFLGTLVFVGNQTSAAEKVELSWWVTHGVEDIPLMERVVSIFEDKNPNIKVTIENIPGLNDYETKIGIALASDTLGDIVYMRGGLGDIKWYVRNIAIELDDLIRRDAEEIDYEDFIENQLPELSYNGHQYALPYDYSNMGIFYNKNVFDDGGVPYPDESWTWDDLLEISKRLSKDDAEGKRIQFGIANRPSWLSYPYELESGGARYFNEDYTECLVDSPEAMEVIRFWTEFETKYHVSPTQAEAEIMNLFYGGKAAMFYNGSWVPTILRRVVDFPFDVAFFPEGPAKRVIGCSGGSWAITSGSEYPEEAWKLLKFITGKEASRILIVEPIRSLPPRKSLMSEWVENITESKLPPASAKVFMDMAVKYGKSVPAVPFEWFFTQLGILPSIYSGELSVEEGCKKLARQINENIKESGFEGLSPMVSPLKQ